MVKIRSIKREHYNGNVYDLSLKNSSSPYFYANRILTHNSLYPHIMIQANLYGRKKQSLPGDDAPIWTGDNKWKVEGVYYSDKLAGVGELLKCWYLLRMYFKRTVMIVEDKKVVYMNELHNYIGKQICVVDTSKNKLNIVCMTIDEKVCKEMLDLYNSKVDAREYSLKIFINIVYGILNNMYYANVYDRTGGGDCTRLGRQWIKHARTKFKNAGYLVIYTDTDSVYILDDKHDKEAMLKVKDEIIKDIKDTVPFPQDTFDMGIDDEIKYMYFFKGGNKDKDEGEDDEDDFINKPKGFMKKNYIYVTKDNKVKIKNLGIKKKDRSALCKKIFWEHLVPKIKEGQIKFSKVMIGELMMSLLKEDLSLALMRKSVGHFKQYQKSPNCLSGQIANRYGAGVHYLIPNTKNIGIGKGKQFCTLEEFKQHNMRLEDIDLDNVWQELDYFIKPPVTKNIFDFNNGETVDKNKITNAYEGVQMTKSTISDFENK